MLFGNVANLGKKTLSTRGKRFVELMESINAQVIMIRGLRIIQEGLI